MILKRLKLLFLKSRLRLNNINSKLPKLFRFTKWGFITTCICLFIASSFTVSYAADSNLYFWNKEYIEVSTNNVYDIIHGEVEETDTGAYLIKGSLLVAANNMLVSTYEQTDQVSATRYMADRFDDAGLVQSVQAAAPGYGAFQPVLNVWKVMRNLSLSFVIIIGIILSVMILLRVRQGQGYVTLINSLPKLILTIILILSSYSIAGFLIDIGNVAEKVIVSMFFNANFIDDTDRFLTDQNVANPNYPYNLYALPPFGIGDAEYSEDFEKDYNVFRLLSRFTAFETWGTVPCGDREKPDWHWKYNQDADQCPLRIADIIRSPTAIPIIDKGLEIAESLPSEQILNIIVSIVILTGILKIFFSLIEAFAKVIIYTMFAPLVLLFFPISSGVLTGWLRYFLASSLVFPVAFLMMFLAAIIMGDAHAPWFTKESGVEVAGVAPNLLTYSTNVNEAQNVPYLTRIIAVFIVMMIPTLPKYLMEVLKVPENIMIAGAKEGFKRVASKVPFIGGMISGM